MIRGTTPTFTFWPEKRDGTPIAQEVIDRADYLCVTIAQPPCVKINLDGDRVVVGEQSISCFLTQEQSLQLAENKKAEVMLNWTYPPDETGIVKRGAAGPGFLVVTKQLLGRALP